MSNFADTEAEGFGSSLAAISRLLDRHDHRLAELAQEVDDAHRFSNQIAGLIGRLHARLDRREAVIVERVNNVVHIAPSSVGLK